jgi:hypothetical protein
MTRTRDWLAGYEKAWRSKDPDDIRALFTEEAEYWFRPNDPEPARGIDEIIRVWQEDEPADPVWELGVLIEDAGLGIIRGWVDYPGHQKYTNLWEVHFAVDGRAFKFVEWFMTPAGGDD